MGHSHLLVGEQGEVLERRADGSFRNLLGRLSRIDVLVIDDWAMAPLSEPERRDFREICEDRYQVRSLIPTRLPIIDGWFTTPTESRWVAN